MGRIILISITVSFKDYWAHVCETLETTTETLSYVMSDNLPPRPGTGLLKVKKRMELGHPVNWY